MTPQQARAALDRHLKAHGQDVTLQRLSSPSMAVAASVAVRAHVSDFSPQELDGAEGLQIGDSKVILSPTALIAASWPGAGEFPLPRKGDRLIIAGRTRTILYGYTAPHVAGELVRIELMVR